MKYTTQDGYTLEAYETMYVDWGLAISRDGVELFSNPSCLSRESYGVNWPLDQYGEPVEDSEGTPWTAAEWAECLESEADDLIEAFVPTQTYRVKAWLYVDAHAPEEAVAKLGESELRHALLAKTEVDDLEIDTEAVVAD